LQFVDTVFVDSNQFKTYEKTLESFVQVGGHLVIMNYNYNEAGLKQATLKSGITFNTFASPLTSNDTSEVLAKTEEGVVISRSKFGSGFITRSSVSLQELYEDASAVASAVLGTIVMPDFTVDSSLANMDTLQVTGSVNASASVATIDNDTVLGYKPTQSGYQINFSVFFEKSMNMSAPGFIQFELWNDGKTKATSLCLIDSENLNCSTFNLSNSPWTGWRTFSIPLTSFIQEQNVSSLREFDGLQLVVVSPENVSVGNEEYSLKMKNLGCYEVVSTSNYRPLEYEWVQPNLLKTSIMENGAVTRLLWKESFDENWQINTDPQIANSTFFYAGPGVMFICIPGNVADVTFFMPQSEISNIGTAISVVTFFTLMVIVLLSKKIIWIRRVLHVN
jgi:hypothetical protein